MILEPRRPFVIYAKQKLKIQKKEIDKMSIKAYTVLWRGKTLITFWGTSEENVEKEILIETGMKTLPPRTVIFESYKV